MYTQNVILMTQQRYAQSTTSRASSSESPYDKSFEQTISEKTKERNEVSGVADRKQSDTKSSDTKSSDTKRDQKAVQKGAQSSTKAPKDPAKTSKAEGTSDEIGEDEALEVIQDDILQLLATQLNIPVEQVQSLLQEQGKSALELLDQDTFMTFVQTTLGMDQQGLLENKEVIKQISDLWDKMQGIVDDKAKIQLPIQMDTRNLVPVQEQTDAPLEQLTTPVVTNEVVTQGSVTEVLPQTIEEVDKHVEIEVTTTEGLEIKDATTTFVLPIENMLETQRTRLWQQQTQQTTGMKHTEHAPVNKQIIDNVDFISLREGKELTVELNPRELGKLTLQVSEHNGVVTTVIKVESERTKELLMENLAVLKENLEQQGLEVGQFQVDVKQNKNQDQMMQQKQKSSKRIQEIIDKHMGELEGAEEVQETTPTDSENELDLKV